MNRALSRYANPKISMQVFPEMKRFNLEKILMGRKIPVYVLFPFFRIFYYSLIWVGREPRQIIIRLFSMANLSINDCSIKEKIKAPKFKQEVNVDQELKEYALQTYRDLSASSLNVSTHHQ